jgi:hypothetical protein
MRIDRTHRPWMLATLLILTASVLLYIPYALSSRSGPRGGSAAGLTYGIIGYALMLYAGLLGARKKVPVWRIGKAQTWMRGHLWMGLLSLPLILFHSGFSWRGPLTAVLMVLFLIVVISGVLGAALQHYLPRLMTTRVPMETIYEEIPHVRAQLRDEAEQLVTAVCGPLDEDRRPKARKRPEDTTAIVSLVEIERADKVHLRDVYVNTVRPFLANPDAPGTELAEASRAAEIFATLRHLLPDSVHPAVADLENICEEERQLNRQIRIYGWLHGWLLVHVPLSIVLLVLGGVHAFMALRY